MTTKYVLMNKDNNRVVLHESCHYPFKGLILSGELCSTYFTSFLPKFVNNTLLVKLKAWYYKLDVVPVSLKEVIVDSVDMVMYDSVWLLHKETDKVYRVWSDKARYKPSRSSLRLTDDRKVMIKGVGKFEYEDFLHFTFEGE